VKSAIIIALSVSLFLAGGAVLGQGSAAPSKSLYAAAGDGDVEQLKLHIARKTNVNKPDERGYPALVYAANAGGLEAVKLLLEAGAQVNAKGPDGRTALIGAAQGGHKEVVDALVAAGADAKAKDESKTTALHLAAALGYKEIAETLIKAGADVNAEDRLNQTPLILARRGQRTEIADLLVQNGAKEPAVLRPDMLYGDGMSNQPTGQVQVMTPATSVEVTLDPNAIREQVKAFDGLAAAIKAIDDKNDVEQKAWIQRRTDNRATLLRAAEKQFGEELAFIKKVATEEKAAKTGPAIDELAAKRKLRNAAINETLLEERRAAREQSLDTMGMGRMRGGSRTARGRTGGAGVQSGAGVYGNTGTTMSRRPTRPEPNEPPVDADTQAQCQAWLNGKPEGKDALLEAVHKLDLAELEGLRVIAEDEAAKKTAATISGFMLARQLRVDKITKQWKLDEERQQKLQERLGTQPGAYPGTGMRGTRGTTGQEGQPGTGRTRRYR
jgi:hypothetical protein